MLVNAARKLDPIRSFRVANLVVPAVKWRKMKPAAFKKDHLVTVDVSKPVRCWMVSKIFYLEL